MMKKLKISFNTPVVLSFVSCCLFVTILGYITRGKSTEIMFMTYHSSLKNPLTYLRLFTHVLGHDGWSHFIGNATYLLLLGPILEEKYGSNVIAKIIVVTALVTGIVNYIFFWNIGLCGASGVVFSFIILASFTGFNDGEIPLSFILVATIFIGQQIYEGIAVSNNIPNISHILGGIVGAITGYGLNKQLIYKS